jgi:hypothetical protein
MRWARTSHALAACLFASALGGCWYTSGIRSDEKVRKDRTYLYGRFAIAPASELGGGQLTYLSMGLVVRCEDGASYTFKFLNKRDVQVIEAQPSRCALAEVIYTNDSGMISSRSQPLPSWVHTDVFAPGTANYLGDYFAVSKIRPITFGRRLTWMANPVDDRYESTTADMQRAFPHLAVLETMDKRLAPRRRPLGPPVAGPPLSPERVARIAPFTNRRYADPAACAAACPKGQCLPFRGETGPAMACIIACTSDQDCPQGLACNCSSARDPECKPIARTPGDAMEGICLSTEPPASSGSAAGGHPPSPGP